MRKIPLRFTAALMLAIIMLAGCRKDAGRDLSNENNASFIDYNQAEKIATRISPDNIFDPNKPDAHNAIESGVTVKDNQNNPAYYIFSLKDTGFIVISADRNLMPLLAYSTTSKFKQPDKAPVNVKNWLEKTKEAVEIVRKGRYDNSKTASRQWAYVDRRLQNSAGGPTARVANEPPDEDPCDNITYHEVLPLLPVTWGQGCTYNSLCPTLGGPCGYAVTGCVATAMAQIIGYYKYPYYTYDWTNLPGDHGNYTVQRLMRDAGYSVFMQYGAYSSGAYMYDIDDAFRNTFGYNAIHNYYSETKVVNDVSLNRPVIMSGVDAGAGGHAWVCDGYWMQTNPCMTTTYMHMNWGWHETDGGDDYNGYFWSASWSVAGYNFQYYKEIIIGITP